MLAAAVLLLGDAVKELPSRKRLNTYATQGKDERKMG
jgi:hypothetical protein